MGGMPPGMMGMMGGMPPAGGSPAAGSGAGAGAAAGGFNPAMMGMMGGPMGGAAAADTRPPKEKYAEQIQQIKEMGFPDEDAIAQILEQTGGNVQLALEKLFS